MSKLTEAAFIAQLLKDLIALGRFLYKQFKGDVGAARTELRRIPDHWAGTEANRADVAQQMAELKAQGK